MSGITITRRDVSRLDASAAVVTAAGLRVPARLTRVGVLEYSDGAETWGELKTPDEVFAPESLATLRGCPVTDLHPNEMVTPASWQKLARGHVGDDVRADRSYVRADVVVAAADLQSAVQRGDRVEISCGYEVDLVEQGGVWEGVPYRYVHKNIRYNHVALGPENWGRAGSAVRLLDAGGKTKRLFAVPRALVLDGRDHPRKATMKLKNLTLNGTAARFDDREYDITKKADRDALQTALRADAAAAGAVRLDAIEPAQIQPMVDMLMGHVAGLQEVVMQLGSLVEAAVAMPESPEAAAEMIGPEMVAELADARANVVTRARELAPEIQIDKTKSNAQIMREALVAAGHETKIIGRSDSFLEGVFLSVPTKARTDEDKIVASGARSAQADGGNITDTQKALRDKRRENFAARRKTK